MPPFAACNTALPIVVAALLPASAPNAEPIEPAKPLPTPSVNAAPPINNAPCNKLCNTLGLLTGGFNDAGSSACLLPPFAMAAL